MFNHLNEIPIIGGNCQEVIKINKGFSNDEKYLLHMQDSRKVLLRTFHLKEIEFKRTEYAILQNMQDYNIRCSQPLAFGEIDSGGYIVTSYIEGQDAEEEIPTYSTQEQYNIGIDAGKELRKMHQLPAPTHISSWYTRKVEKHKNYLNAYRTCGIKVKNDHKIMNFIDDNIELMRHRPNLFQHDDFHPGNIIVKDKKFAGVIDFNRYDWGDPIHEFLKIGIFSRNVSIPFSIGQIKGYFHESEPDEHFWTLYSLYLAMCVFSTVVWTLKAIPDKLDEMLDKLSIYLEDHDYFNSVKPKWYQHTMK
ncbi:aminoglycoside phosphotransferase family protein [Metabacillus malikii]|uniref:aminoglycoside phosphotransferase family protein n=1 Tax=Metabacillus malikii TaxID=1504265 RepID=UPI00352273F4